MENEVIKNMESENGNWAYARVFLSPMPRSQTQLWRLLPYAFWVVCLRVQSVEWALHAASFKAETSDLMRNCSMQSNLWPQAAKPLLHIAGSKQRLAPLLPFGTRGLVSDDCIPPAWLEAFRANPKGILKPERSPQLPPYTSLSLGS